MTITKRITRHKLQWIIAYECAMYGLVVLSIGMLLYDVFGRPTEHQVGVMDWVDFGVACIFMVEFLVRLARSNDKWQYIRQDWWLFVASIPVTGVVGDALRAMRLLGVIRIVRIASHVTYETRKVLR